MGRREIDECSLIFALPELEGLGLVDVFEKFAGEVEEVLFRFCRGGIEELASLVDPVHSAIGKAFVHLRLEVDGVVGEEQSVRVDT